MQKGLTGIRPVANITKALQGVVSVAIFNNSAVNLYLGDDDTSATKNIGLPILPNTQFGPTLWEGDLWIGSDIDNTEFRYIVSKPISFDDSKQNSGQNVQVTPQGFLSPRGRQC